MTFSARSTAQEHPMRMTEEQYRALMARRGWTALSLGEPSTKSTKPVRLKYGNRKVTDGEGNVHDSTKEYRHWCDLELRERAGEIRSLRRQVPYALVVNGILICQYIADFVFEEGSATVVVDAKSPPTRAKPEYRIKLKLMQAIHKIQIREV